MFFILKDIFRYFWNDNKLNNVNFEILKWLLFNINIEKVSNSIMLLNEGLIMRKNKIIKIGNRKAKYII